MRYDRGIAGLAVAVLAIAAASAFAAETLQPEDIVNTRYATSAKLSPDGKWVAHTVSVPRAPDEKAGGRYAELHVVSTASGKSRPFVTGKVNVSALAWSPDGTRIGFLTKRGQKAKPQVWAIAVDGGEAVQLSRAGASVRSFAWHPSGQRIFYIATAAKSKREKKLDDLGYGFRFFEEKLEHRNLYALDLAVDDAEPEQLTSGLTVWAVEVTPDGRSLALAASDENLVDHSYVFKRIHILDLETGELRAFSNNPGKLGGFAFSPDGKRIVYTAALTRGDHAASQVFVQDLDGGEARNLTEPDFRGHVQWAGWKDTGTVVYRASEGVWTTLSTVAAKGGKRRVVLDGKELGYGFLNPTHTRGLRDIAYVAAAPDMPYEVFFRKGNDKPRRLTTLNPWLAERALGRCEAITYAARDGYEVEGLLYYPVEYEEGRRYPLVVDVHGGPESHYAYGWRTSYSRPVEVLTGRGYVVFLPNYRSSTGYGLEHTKWHLGDAAGVEFDDVADGIRHLVDTGLVDGERVGLGGGSYGGFAAAWFATYYTDLVQAVVMFVGISDLISKRGTTDIPYEELYVHSGDKLEDAWQKSLERSPIYHAHKSKTATLIIGGSADTRVHPSQSLELFRRMKMNDHPAVRLVQYPGEGHGNRKMPGRRDVLYRTLQWYDWFVKEARPLDGGMPDADLSDQYPLELPEDEKEAEEESKDTALQ
jgi:dipeptidyl aminopeptidase/acylaminoacyl peptidase